MIPIEEEQEAEDVGFDESAANLPGKPENAFLAVPRDKSDHFSVNLSVEEQKEEVNRESEAQDDNANHVNSSKAINIT